MHWISVSFIHYILVRRTNYIALSHIYSQKPTLFRYIQNENIYGTWKKGMFGNEFVDAIIHSIR